MHQIVQRLIRIENQIKEEIEKNHTEPPNFKTATIIAISKTFPLEIIMPLIDYGHLHYGENKVQEAKKKWTNLTKEKSKLRLHFVGKLQTNKVKHAINFFDFIHSLDSEKLATKISQEQKMIMIF